MKGWTKEAIAEMRRRVPAAKPVRSKYDSKLEERFHRDHPQYRHHPIKIRIAEGCWYTPDFGIERTSETSAPLILVEVKGFMREAARVRLRVAADIVRLWAEVHLVTWEDGTWKWEQM